MRLNFCDVIVAAKYRKKHQNKGGARFRGFLEENYEVFRGYYVLFRGSAS